MSSITASNSTILESKLINANPISITMRTVYLGSLRINESGNWNHFCTGFYVASNVFLTTGVCIRGISDIENVHIYLNTQGLYEPVIYKILRLEMFSDFIAKRQNPDSNRIPRVDVGLIMVSEILHYNLFNRLNYLRISSYISILALFS